MSEGECVASCDVSTFANMSRFDGSMWFSIKADLLFIEKAFQEPILHEVGVLSLAAVM